MDTDITIFQQRFCFLGLPLSIIFEKLSNIINIGTELTKWQSGKKNVTEIFEFLGDIIAPRLTLFGFSYFMMS